MADFHQHFRSQIRALQDQVDSLSSPEIPLNERKIQADQALSSITKLSAELADASGDLPSYDQRSYNLAIKDLHDKLIATQASHAPKAKFSFKNKRLAATTPEVNSAATSRSATPSHVQDPDNALQRDLAVPPMPSPPTHLSTSRDRSQDGSEEHSPMGISVHAGPSQLSFESASNAYLRHPHPEQRAGQTDALPSGQSCVVTEVKSSVINLASMRRTAVPATPSLTLNNISWSFILAPNIKGPAHITGLNNSAVVLSCRQLRMHKSRNVDVYLYCSSRPIIEDCSNITFSSIPSVFAPDAENGGQTKNMFDQVDDFKWLRAEPSPNWRLMDDSEQIKEDKWQDILKTLGAHDKELQQGHTPDPATVLFAIGRSEVENVP